MSTSAHSQNKKLSSVSIEFEGFFTETIADINCDDFRNVFRHSMKVKLVNDSIGLSRFSLLVTELKEEKKYRSLDVRGIITLHYEKSTDEYCFDKFGYFYKEGIRYHSKKLLRFISDQVYSNHPKYLD
jgi:hypothetical protein